MDNGISPQPTGSMHWLTYHPGYAYCFIPSFEADEGDYVPDFVKDFSHYFKLKRWDFEIYFILYEYL